MIRHQAIYGAQHPLPSRRVKHDFAEASVERIIKPASFPIRYRKTPMNDGIALVMFGRKTGQIEGAVRTGNVGFFYRPIIFGLLHDSPRVLRFKVQGIKRA